jgi:hypothetical protein
VRGSVVAGAATVVGGTVLPWGATDADVVEVGTEVEGASVVEPRTSTLVVVSAGAVVVVSAGAVVVVTTPVVVVGGTVVHGTVVVVCHRGAATDAG